MSKTQIIVLKEIFSMIYIPGRCKNWYMHAQICADLDESKSGPSLENLHFLKLHCLIFLLIEYKSFSIQTNYLKSVIDFCLFTLAASSPFKVSNIESIYKKIMSLWEHAFLKNIPNTSWAYLEKRNRLVLSLK